MNYLDSIQIGLDAKKKHTEIARKIFLSHPTSAFVGHEETQFEVLNEVSTHFKVPITSVQVVGSSKIGESLHKKTKFNPAESDLDIAIIDANLFIYYSELVFSNTKGFSDTTGFSIKNGISTFLEYSSYLNKGMFRPDLMPSGNERGEWSRFFGRLSSKHSSMFKSITAAIYLSQKFFEIKQTSVIRTYLNQKNGGL